MWDQDRLACRRPDISFSHGARWKALIKRYIGIIPLSGDIPAIEHMASAGSPPRRPVSSAMMAKVGAAARYSQSAAFLAMPLRSSGMELQPPMPAWISLMTSLLPSCCVPRGVGLADLLAEGGFSRV